MTSVRDYTKISSSGIEIQNGLSGLLTGTWLLLHVNTFASTPSYQLLADIAPEWVWGLLFLIFGITQLTSVSLDQVRMRRISSALLALLFIIYISGVFTSNPYSLAMPFIIPMILGQIFSFYRARLVR